jgi:hypothetical protein
MRSRPVDFTLVNPQPKYQPVKLIEPPPLGYIHVGAAVAPPVRRIPRPGSSPNKKALLARLKNLRH